MNVSLCQTISILCTATSNVQKKLQFTQSRLYFSSSSSFVYDFPPSFPPAFVALLMISNDVYINIIPFHSEYLYIKYRWLNDDQNKLFLLCVNQIWIIEFPIKTIGQRRKELVGGGWVIEGNGIWSHFNLYNYKYKSHAMHVLFIHNFCC